jgi:hypothetical protein
MATGQVLFHRFFYRKSFREYDVKVCVEIYETCLKFILIRLQSIAISCIFLSAKVEESPKKVRDVINVYYHLTLKRDGIPKPDPIDITKQV